MSRYSDSLRFRARRILRRWLTAILDLLRAPLRVPEVLLVTGSASPAKVTEIEGRLGFLFEHLDAPPRLRTTTAVKPWNYLRPAAIAAVDTSAIPSAVHRGLHWVFDLDYDTNLADGWTLMDLGVALTPTEVRDASRISAYENFTRHVRRIKLDGARPVYLFGTGPSLQLANERSFDDGTTVVCNTIVRDPDLWHHLNPSILTAGDAIYHFGHNAHARAFRHDALQRLRESGGRTLFVYPAPYDVIVRAELEDVESLLVPIEWGQHSDISVDLIENFALPDLENVLANLLLPLACTLSQDVRLWGFDGRGPTDTGFWANSNRHAYPDLMQSIRDAHPAFFANKTPTGNEINYVNQVHGDLLDERLSEAEQRGFTFEMMHRSWTPTLQKRFREPTSP